VEGTTSDSNRRQASRFDVSWTVDCKTESTFLYAAIRNISELGIFVLTTEPLEIGTRLLLEFAPPDAEEPFSVHGIVQWINPVRPLAENLNPGMGVLFVDLTPEVRERLVDAVRTIAYVHDTKN
jgi:type IV pilus assembly protein PilZ